MNKFKAVVLAAIAALGASQAASAATNDGFVGSKVEVTAGVNDIQNARDTNDVVYGAAVGFDVPVGDRITLGAEVNTSNIFESERQVGVAARVGYAFTGNTLGYVKGGYTNYRDSFSRSLDGATVGAGVEHKISKITYVKAEYRYSDFAKGAGDHAAVVGIGLRF